MILCTISIFLLTYNKIKLVRATIALQEPAELWLHLFHFIAHETSLYVMMCGVRQQLTYKESSHKQNEIDASSLEDLINKLTTGNVRGLLVTAQDSEL